MKTIEQILEDAMNAQGNEQIDYNIEYCNDGGVVINIIYDTVASNICALFMEFERECTNKVNMDIYAGSKIGTLEVSINTTII